MIRQLNDNSSNVILKLRQNSINIVVMRCLTKYENGEVNHSKCSGSYQDNYGFGYTMRCSCGCHKRDEVTK
jgi:hypothetical protein